MKLRLPGIFGAFFLIALNGHAQENILTAGIQVKPFFTNKFFKTGPQDNTDKNVLFTLSPQGGYAAGGVVRYGLNKTLSFESAINFIKRPYELFMDSLGLIRESGSFAIIGYEIPVSALVFIQLSDHLFMNASMGLSADFFPSNVRSSGTMYIEYSNRKSWIFAAVNGNMGIEFRTSKSGSFYLGASYHRPFENIYVNSVIFFQNAARPDSPATQFDLSGNYLSLDFKYFFHQEPLKKQSKKRPAGGE